MEYRFILGTVEDFDALGATIKDAETGEKTMLRLSEHVDMLQAAKQSGEPWFFSYSPDMTLMLCCPVDFMADLESSGVIQ